MKYKTIQDGLNDVVNKPYYDYTTVEDYLNIDEANKYNGCKTFHLTTEDGVEYEIEIDIRYDSELQSHTYDFSYEIVDEIDSYKQIKAYNFYKLYNTICYLHITTLMELFNKTGDIPLMKVKGVGGRDENGNRLEDYRKVDMAIRLLDRHYPVDLTFKDSEGNSIIKLNNELFKQSL